jgi:phosphoglycolate phosphatase-like HAD superfamily hydrolase
MTRAKYWDLLKAAQIVFWDFDGVIKDSVAVKTDAFTQLFAPYGPAVAKRVRDHHEANGGMSRYEKIPIYLTWADVPVTDENITLFCDKFALQVQQQVVDSRWIPGVREYLVANSDVQYFVLVTATPLTEIQQIVHTLDLEHHFREIHGAPASKALSIKDVLERRQCPAREALMIGDSGADLEAAQANYVPFLLRRTRENATLQQRFHGPVFDDLSGIDDDE